jgi:hypothetical protein
VQVLLNPETGSLRASEFEGCEWLEEARPAALADLLKCHELHYLERVKQTCLSLDREEEELGQLDGDTSTSCVFFSIMLAHAQLHLSVLVRLGCLLTLSLCAAWVVQPSRTARGRRRCGQQGRRAWPWTAWWRAGTRTPSAPYDHRVSPLNYHTAME